MNSIAPSHALQRLAGKAIGDFSMIRAGDRILLGVSGGKDSLSLLHTLLYMQVKSPVRFELAAVTVDPQQPEYDPRPLRQYIPSLGIPYFYETMPVLRIAQEKMGNHSFCAFCSRMRRGMLYGAARREGYNVLALAQHLDDLAETFWMSACFGGKLRTMRAHYVNDAGDLRVIRPFVYVRERQTSAFAQSAGLPVIPENCPACFAMPMQRWQMKQRLAEMEKGNAKLFPSLLTAMRPLLGSAPEAPPASRSRTFATEKGTSSLI